ncbi:hypothetical protein AAG570_005942 [Ranatra chinensis]|uniref:Uncharacterized protein n=1 Tax=Ranatra chinensis TaxID=642074 RepID=A0ABD0XWK7_9HEMI
MASKRRNMFQKNKKQETTENVTPVLSWIETCQEVSPPGGFFHHVIHALDTVQLSHLLMILVTKCAVFFRDIISGNLDALLQHGHRDLNTTIGRTCNTLRTCFGASQAEDGVQAPKHTRTKKQETTEIERHFQNLSKQLYCDHPQMASKRRNMFYKNKKQETTEISTVGCLAGMPCSNKAYGEHGVIASEIYLQAVPVPLEDVLFGEEREELKDSIYPRVV